MPSPKAQEFPIDPGSPLFITGAVLTCGAAGGLTGATIGYVKNIHPMKLGVHMSINCSIASLAFFGTREYLVSPILLGLGATPAHARRAAILRGDTDALAENQSMMDVRLERVLDSAIAGALSGGALSVFARGFGLGTLTVGGPRTLFPAAFTASLIAAGVQVAVNQARVTRLEMLAKRDSQEVVAAEPMPQLLVREAFEDTKKPEGAKRGDAAISTRILGVLTNILPIRRLDNDEYLGMLERKRKEVDRRLAEIDKEQLDLFEKRW